MRARVAFFVLLLAGCGSDRRADSPREVSVAAASSLTDVLPEIARAFERDHAGQYAVALRFGGSSMLARQIREGAPTDAFVAADPRWIDDVLGARLADPSSRRLIATNRLVAIVPSNAAVVPRNATELAALAHIAVAAPEVPAGTHARTALERSGVLEVARPHLVDAADVRAALAWVARGEAEAGIVYATDAQARSEVRIAFTFEEASHAPIRYEAVAIAAEPGAEASQAGREFVVFLSNADARRILERSGFGGIGQ